MRSPLIHIDNIISASLRESPHKSIASRRGWPFDLDAVFVCQDINKSSILAILAALSNAVLLESCCVCKLKICHRAKVKQSLQRFNSVGRCLERCVLGGFKRSYGVAVSCQGIWESNRLRFFWLWWVKQIKILHMSPQKGMSSSMSSKPLPFDGSPMFCLAFHSGLSPIFFLSQSGNLSNISMSGSEMMNISHLL